VCVLCEGFFAAVPLQVDQREHARSPVDTSESIADTIQALRTRLSSHISHSKPAHTAAEVSAAMGAPHSLPAVSAPLPLLLPQPDLGPLAELDCLKLVTFRLPKLGITLAPVRHCH
jgi:hypothetical protein